MEKIDYVTATLQREIDWHNNCVINNPNNKTVGLSIEKSKEAVRQCEEVIKERALAKASNEESNCNITCVSISFIQQLIDKYEDKIQSIQNLQKQPIDRAFPNDVNKAQEERLNLRLHERKTFLDDLKSLLNEC